MLTQEQREFYQRWQEKAHAMPTSSVEECIDKYVTLFIAYNFLYNTVPEKLACHTHTPLKFGGDKEAATLAILEFLGAENLLAQLTPNDIADLVSAMPHFNISLTRRGNPQPKIDGRLRTHLQSANHHEKALALLETLYYVRCNVVHGRKGLEPYQVLLLEPVMKVLAAINSRLFQDLCDFPA